MKLKITQKLVERYHLGECTKDEITAVEEWLNSSSTPEIFAPADLDLEALEKEQWEHLADKIGTSSHYRTKSNLRLWFRIAACLLLISSLALYFFIEQQKPLPINYLTVLAPKGKKVSVTLPDGTVVRLNSASTLKYPETFSDSSRQVEFIGEGYFEVAKDAHRPFSIKSKHTLTQVLGTKFNIRAYPEEVPVSVAVEEGSVRFRANPIGKEVVLTANKEGVFDGKQLSENSVYTSRITSWRKNTLSFTNETLAEVALKLQRWYNVQIIIKDESLLQERYTGSFDNPSMDDVLNSLSFALESNYQKAGKTITITK